MAQVESSEATVGTVSTATQATAPVVNYAGSNYFKRFDENNDIVVDHNEVTEPLWSTQNSVSLPFVTAAGAPPTNSAVAYYTISSTAGWKVFDAAYCIKSGTQLAASSQQKAAYAALHTTLLANPSATNFVLDDVIGTSGSHVVVAIAIPRSNYKQRLDEGQWEIGIYSGNVTASYIDDSSVATGSVTVAGFRTRIISGTVAGGGVATTTYYGYCYNDLGLLVFDAASGSTSDYEYSPSPFATGNINWVTSGAVTSAGELISYIEGRSSIVLNSVSYFCRAMNKEFNYSVNPTFADNTNGDILIDDFLDNGPKTYATTIGLYNEKNELLAVGKVSQPIQKSFTSEFVIRVRLDF